MPTGSAGERTVRRYRIAGRVQGVGFRWFVRERARALDVAGVVFNDTDGSVIVDVSGSTEQIGRLEQAMAQGPRGATVSGVSVLLDGESARAELQSLPYPFAIKR